jgi:surface antigen
MIYVPWRGKLIRIKVIVSCSILALSSWAGPVFGDALDDQINAMRSQVTSQQAQAANFHTQANDAQTRLAQLRAQSDVLQSQINLTQAKFNKLTDTIAQNEDQLAQQKIILAANLKSMYLDSTVTPIEMLASSQNFSDFLDQQQYQDRIKTKIEDAMSAVQLLQQQLHGQQDALSQLLSDQHGQQEQLAQLQTQANQLLALASQNAAAADAQVQSSNSQLANLKAQQQAILLARFGNGASNGAACGGGYPGYLCNAPQDSIADPWGMFNRECVSYTAYRVAASGRHMPYWGGSGNANQWPDNARNSGIPVDGNPKVGDVAILMAGQFGHAMYVEDVLPGNKIHVSQYNFGNVPGLYSEMTISASGLYFIHF